MSAQLYFVRGRHADDGIRRGDIAGDRKASPLRHPQQMLDVRHLTVRFAARGGPGFLAVDDVSFAIRDGETLAVVGESGSGKSVSALALTRLLPEPPARYERGEVLLDGRDLLALPESELRRVRGGKIAYVFQDPATSLHPVFTVRQQMAEVLALHRPDLPRDRRARDAEIVRALAEVRIVNPEQRLDAYPHELSGGMAQRVGIAMALASRPQLLVADEPTTALDATVQRQIMDLLRELKASRGLSILLITHNFSIIGGLADRVAVMFRGRIVETGITAEILQSPQHPYTRALLDCIPRLGAKRHRLATIDYAALPA
jgi:ABC-type dipeptide/oligopeptide/nickel transport system ATPase component